MGLSIEEIDFSSLSPTDCILLAQELWDRGYNEAKALPVPPDQRAEIERRLAAVEAGTMPVHSCEDARRRILNRKRRHQNSS